MKCTQANLQVSFRVFSKGRSYFPDLRPKNIFFNDYDVEFYASAENKFIFKENYVLQWGIPQSNLQPKLNLPAPIFSQHNDNSAIPMDMCDNPNTFAFRKNFKYHHQWKTALCQGQSEQLR